jgi:hypothetical protein
MKMIKRTVTGDANALKLVQNGKQAPLIPVAGGATANKKLKPATGYIDSGPVTSGDTSFAKVFVKVGSKGSTAGAVAPAKENVTSGMGGRFVK